MREFSRLFSRDVPAEHVTLAIAEPLLEHLVAADSVFPDGLRHVAPERFVVQIDVQSALAPQRQHILGGSPQLCGTLPYCNFLLVRNVALLFQAAAWHHDLFLFVGMTPARADRKAQTLWAGDSAKRVQFFSELAGCNAQHWLLHVEQLRDVGPQLCRMLKS